MLKLDTDKKLHNSGGMAISTMMFLVAAGFGAINIIGTSVAGIKNIIAANSISSIPITNSTYTDKQYINMY